MEQIPDEVIDHILSFLSPYGELQQCRLVCRRWLHAVARQYSWIGKQLKRCVESPAQLCWFHYEYSERLRSPPFTTKSVPIITCRCAHSAAYVDQLLYVFGGCSWRMTTFNDLWTLEPGNLRWSRPLAVGSYPSPKAYAGMCVWRRQLVIFGGWSQAAVVPLHQACRVYNELHFYDIDQCLWKQLVPAGGNWPPPTAAHGCSVLADRLVVTGGLQQHDDSRVEASGQVWVYELLESRWRKPVCEGPQLPPRYAHSQLRLDDNTVLVLGGTAGASRPLRDCWLLRLWDGEDGSLMARWRRLSVLDGQHSPSVIWCHQACLIGGRVLVLSHRNDRADCSANGPSRRCQPPPVRQQTRPRPAGPLHGQFSSGRGRSAETSKDLPCTASWRQMRHERRLRQLDRMQERLSFATALFEAPLHRQRRRNVICEGGYRLVSRSGSTSGSNASVNGDSAQMRLHSLDVSEAVNGSVRWLPCPANTASSPPARKLYSISVVEGELLLFGGASLSPSLVHPPAHVADGRASLDTNEETSNSISILAPLSEISY